MRLHVNRNNNGTTHNNVCVPYLKGRYFEMNRWQKVLHQNMFVKSAIFNEQKEIFAPD